MRRLCIKITCARPLLKAFISANRTPVGEAPLTAAGGNILLSPSYVTFNVHPGQPNGGPSSGFHTEPNSEQMHNVPLTLPGDAGYSPLWLVSVYDNADFPSVHDRATALKARVLGPGVATVNCPIVSMDHEVCAGVSLFRPASSRTLLPRPRPRKK